MLNKDAIEKLVVLEEKYGLDAEGIYKKIKEFV